MKRMPETPEVLLVARSLAWVEDPRELLADKMIFLAHVMAQGDFNDYALLRDAASPEDYREALRLAPPGIFNPATWIFWHVRLGIEPVPPLPRSGNPPARQSRCCPEERPGRNPALLRLTPWGSRIPRQRRRLLGLGHPTCRTKRKEHA